MITRRGFLKALYAVSFTSVICFRRFSELSKKQNSELNDGEIESYVNQIVDSNIVPVVGFCAPGSHDSHHVDSGVCRELHDIQVDENFRIRRLSSTVRAKHFGRPPAIRKEVMKHRKCVKSVKISVQELLALDNDPEYLRGYGRGVDPVENEPSL